MTILLQRFSVLVSASNKESIFFFEKVKKKLKKKGFINKPLISIPINE
jgi:hypothetical protein